MTELTSEMIFVTIEDWRTNYKVSPDVPDSVYEKLIEIQNILKEENK